LKAVKQGNFATWPGLNEDAILKHLKMTLATAKGHLNQRRQNIHSISKDDSCGEVIPPVSTGMKTEEVYALVVDQGQLYTDLTGRFPKRSSNGSSYLMLKYDDFDCNVIGVAPMESCSTMG
jgi:hypothetical protein